MAAAVRRLRDGAPNTPLPTRLQRPTARADLRLTWHEEHDEFVLSLWHGDACVGTAPLDARTAAEVAGFLVAHLGERPGPAGAASPVASA